MFILFFLLQLTSSVMADDCEHDAKNFRCVEFLYNHDGDTLTVEIPDVPAVLGHRAVVRVRGIDAAEMNGNGLCERDMAIRAQVEVSTLLRSAKRIDLLHIDRDKYFRILTDVMVDGKSLSGILISSHLAVPYNGKKKPVVDWCALLRQASKGKKVITK